MVKEKITSWRKSLIKEKSPECSGLFYLTTSTCLFTQDAFATLTLSSFGSGFIPKNRRNKLNGRIIKK
jgi:hypothetical protein